MFFSVSLLLKKLSSQSNPGPLNLLVVSGLQAFLCRPFIACPISTWGRPLALMSHLATSV